MQRHTYLAGCLKIVAAGGAGLGWNVDARLRRPRIDR
jgi:hypothetical protein